MKLFTEIKIAISQIREIIYRSKLLSNCCQINHEGIER